MLPVLDFTTDDFGTGDFEMSELTGDEAEAPSSIATSSDRFVQLKEHCSRKYDLETERDDSKVIEIGTGEFTYRTVVFYLHYSGTDNTEYDGASIGVRVIDGEVVSAMVGIDTTENGERETTIQTVREGEVTEEPIDVD